MSDSSSQDKTEQPSSQKLRKAKEEGNIPRSRELVTASLVLGSALVLTAFGPDIVQMMVQVSELNFQLSKEAAFDTSKMLNHLQQSAIIVAAPIGSILVLLSLITVAANLVKGGWNISVKSTFPKLSKLDPIKGIQRIFSMKSVFELVKSILKVTLIVATLYFLLSHYTNDIIAISQSFIHSAMRSTIDFLFTAIMCFGLALLLIAVLDIPYSSWDHKKELKMTKQEVKDEHKNSEGNPEIKGRIRQLQRQMAMRSMNNVVPHADVIITNPTHYSIAIKYDLNKAKAPFVIAKATDSNALLMRTIGLQHEIPIVQVPPLTRAVYYTTNEWQEIPAALYVAVAHVLTFIFQLKEYQQGRQTNKPELPPISIPAELQY